MPQYIVLDHWSADSPFGFMSSPLYDGGKLRVFQTLERANLYAEHMNASRGVSGVFYAAAPRQLFEERIGPIPEHNDATRAPFAKPRGEVGPSDYETRALLLGWVPSSAQGLWTRVPAEEGSLPPLRTPEDIWTEVEAASVEHLNQLAAALSGKMTYMAASRDLKVGDVVIATEILESYPHYYIEAGTRFVVTSNGLNELHPLLSLRIVPEDTDNMKSGDLKDWGGCLEFYGPEEEGVEHERGVHDDDKDQPGHAWNKTALAIRKDNSALDFEDRLAAVYVFRLANVIGTTLMESVVALNDNSPHDEACASGKFADTSAIIEAVYDELREDRPAEASRDLIVHVKSRARYKYMAAYAASADDEEAVGSSGSDQPAAANTANPLAQPLLELLQYTGGWDLTDEDHPIVKARKAYEVVTGEKF